MAVTAPPHNARLIALAGNPNVGKSTLFNALTGMRQHTGNWPGKTVGSAYGHVEHAGREYILADTPGSYSLLARSREEELARDALLYGGADAIIAVCDATCLQRSLALAISLREVTGKLIICVNLMDEARRRGISVDCTALADFLGVPVVSVSAARGMGLDAVMDAVDALCPHRPVPVCLGEGIEAALSPLRDYFEAYRPPLPSDWLAKRVIEADESMLCSLEKNLGMDRSDPELRRAVAQSEAKLAALGAAPQDLCDLGARCTGELAARACSVCCSAPDRTAPWLRLDRILTHPVLCWPVMALLLAAVLWLTLSGANYPSELLFRGLFALGDIMRAALGRIIPEWAASLLFDGVYRTTAWVVSVMLPPMAIFFPLFTILEDLGFLPRAAFCLDGLLSRCGACGKQALTMCMGFGCNAAGVTGCRIIDSERERLIAAATNSFVPCNGRFPAMIAIISIFFAGGAASGLTGALILTGFVFLGVAASLAASRLLSKTLLRGKSSSFALELPPYRLPRVGEVIVRSVLDRTLFVLARAVKSAAPAGLVIWLLANISVGDATLLAHASRLLDPAGRFLGLDGALLLAFIIALPANEIVIPAALMCYLAQGSLVDLSSYSELRTVLVANGWSSQTALCMLMFTLMHWPCATTLMTVKSETHSRTFTLLCAALPTVFGVVSCLAVRLVCSVF